MKQPRITHWTWKKVLPQLLSLFVLITISFIIAPEVSKKNAIVLGALVFIVYSQGSRMIILRNHNNGLKESDKGNYEKAIEGFQRSSDFLNRYSWIDKYRSIVLMSPSVIEYREMALMNIAHAYNQLGNQDKVREYLERTLKEYPESILAKNTLQLIGNK